MFFNKALYAVLAGMAIPMVSAQYGAFIYSCDDISLSNNYLNANCQGNNDYLRLSDCIENQNGELVWSANGDFSASCYDCYLGSCSAGAGSCIMSCDCDGGGGTSIDLDGQIGNDDGRLICPGGSS